MNPQQSGLPPVEPGTVLAGKYRVARILGQGGMGLVVEARHIALDERVALKFLLPEYASHPEASGRFLREARAAVKIKSEHVARVSDVGTLDTGAPYMVMEYLDGSDLSGVLEKQGVFALEDAVDYVIQGCEAIAEAHSYGIVHRDLKPANLFLTRNVDGSPLVKVLDFGISKMSGAGVEALTRTTAAMGSALYMSPEQMQQTRSVDHRTDIYALGVSLYEMLAGKQPFYAETLPQLCAEILTGTPTPIRTIRPDLPDPFATVLERAYARDRAQRYQTIADFVVALAPWAPARSQGSIERIARMAGLPPPAPGRASLPSVPGQATQPLPPQQPQQPAQPSDPNVIVPGPYSAPQSSKAAAAFATQSNMSTTGRSSSSSGKPLAFVAIAAVLLLGAGGAAFVGLRGHGGTPAAEPTASASAAVAAPAPPPTASAPGEVVTAAEKAEPSAAPSAAPTASATAEPSATTAAAPVHVAKPVGKPVVSPPPAQPAPAAKKPTSPPDIFAPR